MDEIVMADVLGLYRGLHTVYTYLVNNVCLFTPEGTKAIESDGTHGHNCLALWLNMSAQCTALYQLA